MGDGQQRDNINLLKHGEKDEMDRPVLLAQVKAMHVIFV
jgi:hypothetical protein